MSLLDRPFSEVEALVAKMARLLSQALSAQTVLQKCADAGFSGADLDEALSIATARHRTAKIPFPIYMTVEDERFATNWHVAQYRASRLACDSLLEIGCGIGIQTLAFARTCKRVIAVDIDARKVQYARMNAGLLGANNVEFHVADGGSFKPAVKPDFVFCDPARPPEEELRTTASLSPRPETLLQLYPDAAIELPPRIQSVPFDAELEWSSVNHILNRLTAYCGKLKKCERSAVSLPDRSRLENISASTKLPVCDSSLNYLAEPDEAVVAAGLLDKAGFEGCMFDSFITSNNTQSNPFIKASFRVIYDGSDDVAALRDVLRKAGVGEVVVRSADAIERQRVLEYGLEGEATAHVIIKNRRAIVGI
ncbi:methyltransferase domain-containing protein [Candidatus Woesearchaeota archaeon]|nr:methyltransferase domain-containing protein [Candidatus Woesearchaeota archaeon]